MRKIRSLKKIAVAGMIAATAFCHSAYGDNPVVQTSFTADPAPFVFKDTVYLITSHDEDDALGFHMLDWKCYSTTDMVNWTDHGSIASLATFPWARQDNDAWAPQMCERNGKFYLYVPVSVQGWPKNVIAVAVADSPVGPFKDAIGHPLIDKAVGYIDPTVFVDEDGKAYLYFGNPNAWYVTLNPDMISYSGVVMKAEGKPRNYQEGPWLYKRNGRYYLAYASTCCPEGIGYAMSDGPTGPWEFKGNIMDGNELSSGNHPGIIEFKGKSYVFGFNYKLNWELTSVHRERRSVCVAEMTYNADGTIRQLPWWDDAGVNQVGTFHPYHKVQAATICYEKGIKTVPRRDGQTGVSVDVREHEAYIKIKGVDFGANGATGFTARVASSGGATIALRLDSETGVPIGSLEVKASDSSGKWQTESCQVHGARGVHDLYLKFFDRGSPDLSLDWWQFEGP